MKIRRDLNGTDGIQNVASLVLAPDLSHFNAVQRWIYKKIAGKRAVVPEIWIESEVPSELQLKKEKLLYFSIGERKYYEKIQNFEMDPRGNELSVVIDLSQIKDVQHVPQRFILGEAFSVTYRAFYKDESGQKHPIGAAELSIEVVPLSGYNPVLDRVIDLVSDYPTERVIIEKIGAAERGIEAVPSSSFDPDHHRAVDLVSDDPTEQVTIEHKKTESTRRLFELRFVNPTELWFSNPVDGKISLRIEEDESEVSEGIYLEGQYGQGKEYDIRGLPHGVPHLVYILIDFNRFRNPLHPRTLTVSVSRIEHNEDLETTRLFEARVTVEPDSDRTELGFALRHGDVVLLEGLEKLSSEPITIDTPVEWAIQAGLNIELLDLTLMNKASNPEPDGQVDIENFTLEFHLRDDAGQWGDRREWLQFNNKSELDIPPQINLPNGAEPIRRRIMLPCENIYKALPDNTDGKVELSFSYRETQEAKGILGTEATAVSMTISFKLRRYVEKWLALDFGTSAIAAALYDPTFTHDRHLQMLNLNEIHEDILRQGGDGSGEKKIEFEEQGTEFLSSVMYLDVENRDDDGTETTDGDVTQLSKEVVRFSPTTDEKNKSTFVNRVLPSLKMLMGYEKIPLRERRFKVSSNGYKKYAELPVDMVFEAAYKKLFVKYLIPAITKLYSQMKGQFGTIELLKTFGNIVISVPNTFNQTHQCILRDLVLKHITWELIPDEYKAAEIKDRKTSLFFEDKIRFVSESDAVACYYIKRWNQFNGDREFPEDGEYLLIYDIGAGTVDLSYLRVAQTDDGGIEITDLGKIGAIRAGNCLDTCLAKILNIQGKLKKIQFKQDVFTSDPDVIGNLVYLKDYIKNTLKVELSDFFGNADENQSLNLYGELVRRTAVWEPSEFKQTMKPGLFQANYLLSGFLNSITSKVIEKLASTVAEECIEGTKLRVDRVIVSGRTALFGPIQERLLEALGKLTTIQSKESVLNVPPQDLKRAVVLGALDAVTTYQHSRVQSREINAFYGILWKEKAVGAQDYKFKPLLTPGDATDTSNGKVRFEESEGLFQINAGKIDMRFADKLELVKSFTPQPQNDYHHSRSEMITKILEIRKEGLTLRDPSKVPVALKYDENLMLRLRAHNRETKTASMNVLSLEQNRTYEENTWPFNIMSHLCHEEKELLEKIRKGEIPWGGDEVKTGSKKTSEEIEEEDEKEANGPSEGKDEEEGEQDEDSIL